LWNEKINAILFGYPNCGGFIDGKHDHIWYPKRVDMNFTTIRSAKLRCF